MSAGPNCCKANNVDRTSEVFVNSNGRYAFHYWNQENDADAPVFNAEVYRLEKQMLIPKEKRGSDWEENKLAL